MLLPTFLLSPMFSSCQSNSYQPLFFQQEEVALLDEIGETILPASEGSPGAKAAFIGQFMDAFVANCSTLKHQEIIRQGLQTFKQNCLDTHNKGFEKLSSDQRHQLLVELDIAASKHQAQATAENPHYFSLIKQLVLFGFFTSQVGASQVLRYLPNPGRYSGDIPYQEGDTVWAL